jgi:hypothetical protein
MLGGPCFRRLRSTLRSRTRLARSRIRISTNAPSARTGAGFRRSTPWAAAPFAVQYGIVFGGYSFTSHSSVQVGFSFKAFEGEELVAGALAVDPEDRGPYGIALMVYLLGLLVPGKALGWPDSERMYTVLAAS